MNAAAKDCGVSEVCVGHIHARICEPVAAEHLRIRVFWMLLQGLAQAAAPLGIRPAHIGQRLQQCAGPRLAGVAARGMPCCWVPCWVFCVWLFRRSSWGLRCIRG